MKPLALLTALHVCQKDEALALFNLERCKSLGGCENFTLLISSDSNFNAKPVVALARNVFAKVLTFTYDAIRAPQPWPIPQNRAWQETARHIESKLSRFEAWLWWEPDALPLRDGWLSTLATAYKAGERPFAGALCSDHATPFYMNGVGIYPVNIGAYLSDNSALFVRKLPFDRAAGPAVRKHFIDFSNLIIHRPKGIIGAPRGGDPHVEIDEPALRKILEDHPQGQLYHGFGGMTDTKHEDAKPATTAEDLYRRWRKAPLVSVDSPCVRIIHAVERHLQRDTDADRRVTNAFYSWVNLYNTGIVIPAHVWDYPRDSRDIGDTRALPYLKDILLAALNRTQSEDHIMLTNDDSFLRPELTDVLLHELSTKPALSSFRLNFDGERRNDVQSFTRCGGRDLFAFTKLWLREHWHQIPDFFLGELEWDLVLAALIRITAKQDIPPGTLTSELNPACEIYGHVLHENHERRWMTNVQSASPAKQHNLNLMREFYCSYKLDHLITC